jgi:hypothetical protein
MTLPTTRRQLAPWQIVLGLCLLYLALIFVTNAGDPQVFVTLGTRFSTGDPGGTEGYDGQFVFFIAADPFSAPGKLDVPAYRYQRILLPALGRLLALGRPGLIPWTLLIINLVALAGGTLVLERLLVLEGASRWYALTYGLFGGVFMAVRLSLNEPLAYGLALLAILLERRGSPWRAAIILATAILAKETVILFAAGYVVWLFVQKRWKSGVIFAATSLTPFALWQLVLYAQFGSFGIGSGGALATSFEVIPFYGFVRILTEGGLSVFLVLGLLLLPGAILPSLWGLWRSLRDVVQRQWGPYTFLLLANAAVIPFVPFSTYREPLGMLRFITGLVIAVVLYGAWHGQVRVLRYSTLWIVSLLFVLASG